MLWQRLRNLTPPFLSSFHHTRSLLRRHCGYCEQQDTLVDSLTVYEMLLYTALLKRPREEPLSEKREEVEKVLKRLALQVGGQGFVERGGREWIIGGEGRSALIRNEGLLREK